MTVQGRGALVVDSITELIGNTPMIRLKSAGEDAATVLGKLENMNPGGSVKDRIALSMVEAAERDGLLAQGSTIVEPTSGNTGIGLALVAATKGYRLLLTMPEDMSIERRQLFERFGAKLVLTPAIEGMTGAVFAAQQLVNENPGYFMPQQFENPANPLIHEQTTAREILEATGGQIDAFVAGVGTGGTITGVGHVLRREIGSRVRIVAVEPSRSPVLSGGRPGMHNIQGIGASFVPSVLDRKVIDEVMLVDDKDAIAVSLRLAREEGILVGISAGANVFAAQKVARELRPVQTVVTVLCDTGERYLSVKM